MLGSYGHGEFISGAPSKHVERVSPPCRVHLKIGGASPFRDARGGGFLTTAMMRPGGTKYRASIALCNLRLQAGQKGSDMDIDPAKLSQGGLGGGDGRGGGSPNEPSISNE